MQIGLKKSFFNEKHEALFIFYSSFGLVTKMNYYSNSQKFKPLLIWSQYTKKQLRHNVEGKKRSLLFSFWSLKLKKIMPELTGICNLNHKFLLSGYCYDILKGARIKTYMLQLFEGTSSPYLILRYENTINLYFCGNKDVTPAQSDASPSF